MAAVRIALNILVGMACCAATACGQQTVSLAWDPNSETNLAGYVIYYGTASGQYSSSNKVGNATNTTVSGLQEGGNYYFVVIAYDVSGLESDPSNEVNYQVPSSGPIISGLSNQITLEDTTNVVTFTVSRGTNLAGVLSVTALSSDSALMPATNIVVTGSGSNYTATLTPRPNAFGLTTITIVATNGTQTSSSSFLLSVNPVNDAPTLNPIANFVTNLAGGSQAYVIPISGITSGATNENQTLTVTATSSSTGFIPNPNVTYTSANSTGSITLRPGSNATGSALITVSVSDGFASNSQSFTANVLPTISTNTRPSLTAIPDQTADVDAWLIITNQVTDPEVPGRRLTFSLGTGAPSGARINATNGVFTWKPSRLDPGARSVTIVVTDNGVPPLADSRTFSILVNDFAEVGLGSSIVPTGQTGSIPIHFYASAGVTGICFEVTATPAGWCNSFALTSAVPQFASATLTPLTAESFRLCFIAGAGQSLQGTQELAQLTFAAASRQDSQRVHLVINQIGVSRADGSALLRTFGSPGRVYVLGSQPIIEELLLTNGNCSLHLYGLPGGSYIIESTPEIGRTNWTDYFQTTLSNYLQIFPIPATDTTPGMLYRARTVP